jgi:hypothetical protein
MKKKGHVRGKLVQFEAKVCPLFGPDSSLVFTFTVCLEEERRNRAKTPRRKKIAFKTTFRQDL